ncbi:MAG TPA: hypothetical protein VFA48_00010 [Gammaproteobacteria bacterium]|nr:hypothetical protein [Gammaproteobacteria bacterium]
MSYTAATIPNLEPEEYGLKLDDGTLVAVKAVVSRDAVTQQVSVKANVRVVDSNGNAVFDDHGQPIQCAHDRSCPPAYLTTVGGIGVLVKQTLCIALGEADAEVEVNDHIRHAVAAANVATTGYDISSL